MSGPGLIDGYLAELSADLPARIVEELADGLDETYLRYLGRGLAQDAAARAAVAEFGEPRVVMTAFTDSSRGRRTARRLLAVGPGVGTSWAIVLITARAWQWPVPVVARVLFGVMLIAVIGFLAAAALGLALPTGVPGSSRGLRRHRHHGCGGDRHGPDHCSCAGVACRRGGRSQRGPLNVRPAELPSRPDRVSARAS